MPSTRRAEDGQIAASSALASAGGADALPSGSTSACRGPAGCAEGGMGLHPLRRADTEQLQAVGEHDPGGLVDPRARAVDVLDGLVALRNDAALVVPAVVGRGE